MVRSIASFGISDIFSVMCFFTINYLCMQEADARPHSHSTGDPVELPGCGYYRPQVSAGTAFRVSTKRLRSHDHHTK